MTVYIGVDFHPYEQSVAYVDDRDGEIGYRRFLHSDKQSIMAFYRKCGEDAVIGTEATGSLWWFEKLLFKRWGQAPRFWYVKRGNPKRSRL